MSLQAEASHKRELVRVDGSDLRDWMERHGVEDFHLYLRGNAATDSGADSQHGPALETISIGPKDHIGISGPNGRGKSILLELLAAHLPTDLPRLILPQIIGSARIHKVLDDAAALPGTQKKKLMSAYAQLNADPENLLAGQKLSAGEGANYCCAWDSWSIPSY